MTIRSASCPGCGATLDFASAATVTVVCPHCGGGSYRTDVGLDSFGRTAEVVPIATPLELGLTGTHEGQGWTAIGFAQLDHGAGPWNEWVLQFDDGSVGWYAEAQGQIWFTRKVEGLAVPAYDALELEQEVPLEALPTLRVIEKGTGTVVTFRGESPVRVIPGASFPYADLEGAGGVVATFDYGASAGSAAPAVYLGRRVEPQDFGIDPESAAPVEVRAQASRLSCPSCGGVVDRRDPASVRVVCGSCGQILEGDDVKVRAIGSGIALKALPSLALGSYGQFGGSKVQVIAFLVRSVMSGGRRYPWREYLLKTASGGYRWLVESDGHWALVDPVREAIEPKALLSFRGHAFRHFQGGIARVDHVQGEVYWRVRVGETVKVDDYIDPPHILSLERSEKERAVSIGVYVPIEALAAAFPDARRLAEPRGVGACQPNAFRAQTASFWTLGLAFAVAMIVLMNLVSKAKDGDAVGYAFPAIPLLIVLLLPAIIVHAKASTFEVSRWRDSDHPMDSTDEED
jgi:predicted RNA-binding Zn-ribbon protein involved in translation (DUF1610 family)